MKKLLIICALLIGAFSYGQNVIGNAFSIKSLTSTQRDALNVTGRYPIIYNSTTSQYERYNGSAWVRLTDAVTSADITDGAIDILDTDSGIQTSLGLADTSIQTELNDLSTVTWANIPDANVPASAVTQHASAIISAVPSNTITAEKLQYSTETEGEVIKINGGFSTWGFVESENILDGSIDILDTDAGIQTSLGLADSAIQSISSGSIGATELASTTVTPGSYTNTDLTVDADGRITAASNGSGGSGESTTVSDSAELDFTLSTYDITASLIAGSIDETKLDASVNASLDLADSALQNTSVDTFAELDALVVDETLINEADIIDNAFNSDWNADINHTASRNAIYDYVNTLASKTGTETITNKTIDADNNTISNIGASEITDDSILAADLNTTNSPTDNYLYTFDAASGGGTWVSQTGTDDQTAAEVSYDNTSSGLIADDLQDAIDEVAVDELTQAAFDALTTSQKIALGPYIILPDTPSGYSVTIDDDPMSDDGTDSFTWASAEVGAYYDWSLSSSGGGTPVTGFGTIATATDVISIGSISGLSDGTATLTAYLTNAGGQGADATDTAVLGTVLTSPPLSGNANPELITGNALAFGTDEVNGTANITSSSNAVITSELVDDGYEGDYVLRIDADGETSGYARARRLTLSASSSTTYDFALLYKHAGTQSGDFQVSGSVSGQIYNSASLGATTWTLLTGSFTTGASDTSINIDIWCQQPFGSADGTEVMEAKLSIKAQ